MPSPSIVALFVSEISVFIRIDVQTWLDRLLIKNIYTLWGRKRFLLPGTYFSTNPVYPFTLRVTGIKIKDVRSWKRCRFTYPASGLVGSPRERRVLCSLGDRAVAHGNYADSAMSSPSALKGGHITERLGNCLGLRFVCKCCGRVLQSVCTYVNA